MGEVGPGCLWDVCELKILFIRLRQDTLSRYGGTAERNGEASFGAIPLKIPRSLLRGASFLGSRVPVFVL